MVGIALDNDFDIRIANGGFTLEETTNQDIAIILTVNPGELKEYPMIGVGIDGITNDDDLSLWRSSIRENLKKSGLEIDQVNVTFDNLEIEAHYR